MGARRRTVQIVIWLLVGGLLLAGCGLRQRPRLLPYLVVIHGLLDL